MARQDDHDQLAALNQRLEALKRSEAERNGGPPRRSGMSGMGAGMRIAVDLVAGLAVGVVLGLLLDSWLGTSPWMLILFFFLGSGAAFMNVYRTAKIIERQAAEQRAAERAAAGRDRN